MKILSGAELRDFIKERQAKQVRNLRQSWKTIPKLTIFYTHNSPVIDTYMKLKKRYGEDILVEVTLNKVSADKLAAEIEKANQDVLTHGVIVQLPIVDAQGDAVQGADLDEILATISPQKDVDGLAHRIYDPATAVAINWLLTGYNIELKGKKIAIVGQGRLVGAPLARMWRDSGYDITTFDEYSTAKMVKTLKNYDIMVSAAGVPGLIKSEMLKDKAVIVDAGTTNDNGVIKGDIAPEVRENRADIAITPEVGGVGPLTIAALIDNVVIAARKLAEETKLEP